MMVDCLWNLVPLVLFETSMKHDELPFTKQLHESKTRFNLNDLWRQWGRRGFILYKPSSKVDWDENIWSLKPQHVLLQFPASAYIWGYCVPSLTQQRSCSSLLIEKTWERFCKRNVGSAAYYGKKKARMDSIMVENGARLEDSIGDICTPAWLGKARTLVRFSHSVSPLAKNATAFLRVYLFKTWPIRICLFCFMKFLNHTSFHSIVLINL